MISLGEGLLKRHYIFTEYELVKYMRDDVMLWKCSNIKRDLNHKAICKGLTNAAGICIDR